MEMLENGGTAEQRWRQMADYPYGSPDYYYDVRLLL